MEKNEQPNTYEQTAHRIVKLLHEGRSASPEALQEFKVQLNQLSDSDRRTLFDTLKQQQSEEPFMHARILMLLAESLADTFEQQEIWVIIKEYYALHENSNPLLEQILKALAELH